MSTTFYIKTINGVVPVLLGDFATLLGTATIIAGTGPLASVTALLSTGDVVTFKASDAYTPEGSTGPAINCLGKGYDVGSQVTVPGQVTALTVTGATSATIWLTLYSGVVVTIIGTQVAVASSGSAVEVNGLSVSNPDFNATTPAPTAGMVNIVFQTDGSGNVSGEVPAAASLPIGSGNKILATPANGSSGVMAPRTLVAADIPNLAPVFNVKNYGAIGDGAADDSTAVIATIAAAYAAGGGTVYFPVGTYKILSQLLIPNNSGAPYYEQVPLRLLGDGPSIIAAHDVTNGGSILDLRNNAATAKIDTRGFGYLEMARLTLTDGGTDAAAFLFTTQTTLHIHDCAFWGNTVGSNSVSSKNDAIILGGTDSTFNNTATSAFAGYGTVIENNYFTNCKRAIFGQSTCNSVQIVNNIIDGGSYITGGAFEFSGHGPNDGLNYIAGNLFEVIDYKYGINFLQHSSGNTIVGNAFWDSTGLTVACIYFSSGCKYNTVISSNQQVGSNSTLPEVLDSDGTNILISSSSQGCVLSNIAQSSSQVHSWNADTGISRTAAGVLAIGNGTQGDYTGSLVAASLYVKLAAAGIDTTTNTDAFAGGSLSGSWTTLRGSFTVGAGVVTGTSLTGNIPTNIAVYTGTWSNDQFSTITIAAPGSNLGGVMVRIAGTGASVSGYFAGLNNGSPNQIRLFYVNGSTFTQLGATYTPGVAVSAGDILELQVVGTSLKVIYTPVGTGTPSVVVSATDSNLSSGKPGIAVNWNVANATLKLWSAGTSASSGVETWLITESGSAPNTLSLAHSGTSSPTAIELAAGVVQIGSTDTGISRLAAAGLAIGNGTAGDVTGSLTLATLVVSGATWTSGTVAPNSNVVGSIGDMYTNKNGTTSTTLWVKESGAATNTGWVAK